MQIIKNAILTLCTICMYFSLLLILVEYTVLNGFLSVAKLKSKMLYIAYAHLYLRVKTWYEQFSVH